MGVGGRTIPKRPLALGASRMARVMRMGPRGGMFRCKKAPILRSARNDGGALQLSKFQERAATRGRVQELVGPERKKLEGKIGALRHVWKSELKNCNCGNRDPNRRKFQGRKEGKGGQKIEETVSMPRQRATRTSTTCACCPEDGISNESPGSRMKRLEKVMARTVGIHPPKNWGNERRPGLSLLGAVDHGLKKRLY